MNYAYTASNQLEEPQTYMYSPYGGEDFLRAYVGDRLHRINALHRAAAEENMDAETVARAFGVLRSLFDSVDAFDSAALDALVQKLRALPAAGPGHSPAEMIRYSPDHPVVTIKLLEALLEVLLADGDVVVAKAWLDRLVQRFEVTKKLYAVYAPGLRKGEGASVDVRPYWLFALCLALWHARSGKLQYLSTELKVVDLLLSLPAGALSGSVSRDGMSLLVAAELCSVRRLAHGRKVAIDVD